MVVKKLSLSLLALVAISSVAQAKYVDFDYDKALFGVRYSW
jgi:hypothetical protein